QSAGNCCSYVSALAHDCPRRRARGSLDRSGSVLRAAALLVRRPHRVESTGSCLWETNAAFPWFGPFGERVRGGASSRSGIWSGRFGGEAGHWTTFHGSLASTAWPAGTGPLTEPIGQ